MILGALSQNVVQVIGAGVSAIVVILIGAAARYGRRLQNTVAKVPEMAKKLDIVEQHTNGEMAKQFKNVREDIALLKTEFGEVMLLKERLQRLEVQTSANEMVRQLLAAKEVPPNQGV